MPQQKPKKKTILYVITQSEFGGAQRYLLDLASGLNDNFNILIAFGEQAEKGKLAEKLKKLNIKYYIVPHLRRRLNWLDDIRAWWNLVKLFKKTKADIIHLNSSKVSILGSLATMISNLTTFPNPRLIYTVHGWVFNEKLPPGRKKFYLQAEKYTSFNKDRLICVSEFDRQLALQNKIAPSQKLTSIHNGIKPFNLLPRDEARRIILDKVPSGFKTKGEIKFLIGSIGNLYKNKGYHYAINAIHLLAKQNIGAKMIVIGDGPQAEEMQRWLKQLKMADDFAFVGRIDNASKLLAAFDIYLCSSEKEGLSYTLIEAMMAGLPIVATRVGGNQELIRNDQEGLLVEAQDPEALAKAVVRIIKDPVTAEAMAKKARVKALTEFRLESMIQKTKYIYDNNK